MDQSTWLSYIGTRPHASDEKSSRSSATSSRKTNMPRHKLVLCIRNEGFEVSLERNKIYQLVADRVAAVRGQMRVLDESGDDYLYPATYFAPIQLPRALRRAVLAA
jgi:hypothetical protein